MQHLKWKVCQGPQYRQGRAEMSAVQWGILVVESHYVRMSRAACTTSTVHASLSVLDELDAWAGRGLLREAAGGLLCEKGRGLRGWPSRAFKPHRTCCKSQVIPRVTRTSRLSMCWRLDDQTGGPNCNPCAFMTCTVVCVCVCVSSN